MSDKEYIRRELAKVIPETELLTYSEEQILDLMLRKDEFFVLNEGLLHEKYDIKIESRSNVLFHKGKDYIQEWKPELIEKYRLLIEGSNE